MKGLLPGCLFLLATTVICAQEAPKDIFILTINGEKHTVLQGDAVPMTNLPSDATVSIELAPYKVFDGNAVSFEFPSDFAFDYESDPGIKTWTFDGDDVVLLYFELTEVATLEEFSDGMIAQFGRSNSKVSATSIKLGGKTLKGQRIDVTLVGQKLSVDLFEVPNNFGGTVVFVIQDSKTEEGKNSTERAAVVSMLNTSFKYR